MTDNRIATVERKTNETDVRVTLDLDGGTTINVSTGIGFFDHMLTTLAFWAGWDLDLACKGDLEVDCHHTVEDTGLVLGQALARAQGDDGQIERIASALAPLDEALSQAVVDLSGRPYWVIDLQLQSERVGTFETSMTGHFFRSFATTGKLNLHLRQLEGANDHHIIESMCKALGLALRQALQPRAGRVASTKGSI